MYIITYSYFFYTVGYCRHFNPDQTHIMIISYVLVNSVLGVTNISEGAPLSLQVSI